MPLTPDSPQESPVFTAFPLWEPQVIGCKGKILCFGPLKECAFVSSGLCLSLANKNLAAFHQWMVCGQLISALATMLGNPVWGLGFTPLGGKLPQPCYPSRPRPRPAAHGSGARLFHNLAHPTGLEVVSSHSWKFPLQVV